MPTTYASPLVATLAGAATALLSAPLAPLPAAPAPDDPPADADALVDALAPLAHPPGRKDRPRAFGPMRVGWALWDTGEGTGGYLHYVSRLHEDPPTPEAFEDAATIPEVLGYPLPPTMDVDELGTGLWSLLYGNPHASYDHPGPGTDFDAGVLAWPEIDLVVAQAPVLSPLPDGAGGWTFHRFDAWDALAASAAAAGVHVAQNAGMTAHWTIPSNDFDFALAHPLVTRLPGRPPLVNLTPLGAIATNLPPGEQPGATVGRYPLASAVDPAAAALLRASLEDRVDAWPDGSPTDAAAEYHIAGGEFFLHAPTYAPGIAGSDLFWPCGAIVDFASYEACLPLTDYSEASLAHFRAWLARRYGGIEAVDAAWGTAFGALDAVDPLDAGVLGAPGVGLEAVRDDWLAFQREQWLDEAHGFQYRAAKRARPDETVLLLDWNQPEGEQRAALRSDGAALAAFYSLLFQPGEALPLVHTEVKREALLAGTLGETFVFPFFGMPKRSQPSYDEGPCWAPWSLVPPKEEVPATFEPPCWEELLCWRTVREMIALGADSLGVAYWEAIDHWTAKWADFVDASGESVPLAVAMAREVRAWREARALGAAWRSPLLVHAPDAVPSEKPASAAEVALGWRVLDGLVADHAQLAPFTMPAVLDDLWATSERDALLSSFRDDLDGALLDRYRDVAAKRGIGTVFVLARASTLEAALGTHWDHALAADHCLVPQPSFPSGSGLAMFASAGGQGCAGPVVQLLAVDDAVWSDDALIALLDAPLVPYLEVHLARSLCPVRVDAGGAPARLDVTVASDGLGLLVSVANAGAEPSPPFTLVADAAVAPEHAPAPAGPFTLPAGGSLLVRMPPALPAPPDAAALAASTEGARARVAELAAQGFATGAADALVAALDELLAAGAPADKVLAGLVRLRRTPFLRTVDADGATQLEAVRWDGEPIVGAPVQAEFVLQDRARLDLPPTDAAGRTPLPAAPLAGAEVWDLELQAYVAPAGDDAVVEVELFDPRHGSQAALRVE